MGCDSSVVIATPYGLDGPGIGSPWWGWGANYSATVQTGLEDHPASYTIVTESFPGVKWRKRGVDHTSPSSTEVKESVELYIYSPSGSS